MKVPKAWEILDGFKESARDHGWKAAEREDWIEADGSYHSFLYTRDVPLSSFRKIVTSGKCVVREGLSYRVVRADYTAWLFLHSPSENLVRMVAENPEFSNRIAIYDLSPMTEGKSKCGRLNSTGSTIFHEFENFLKKEMSIELKSIGPGGSPSSDTDRRVVVELA